ncbi:MAG TPA: hypothetical protein VD833_08840 [Vicinamibacterales bacterium]|nr:hypothetical protein [Vicinamibacterales bacterium]
MTPKSGQIRISRDVAVQVDERTSELAVLSDTPGVVGEELTLALVSNASDMDLRVRVIDSRPQIVSGVLRHRVRLQLLSAEIPPASGNGNRKRSAGQ